MMQQLSYQLRLTAADYSLDIMDGFRRRIELLRLRHRAKKYERSEDPGGIACIKTLVTRGHTVFDIGAHKGGYLYFFRQQLGNSGSIHAFEPQQPLFQYLRMLRQLFHWDNLQVLNYAVSDREGEATLGIPRNGRRHSSPCATIIQSRMAFEFQRTEAVTTISIDNHCKANQLAPDFLKVDVEGNELNVFRGAQEILRIKKPPILFECEVRFVGEEQLAETFSLLKSYGYRGHFILGKSIIRLERFNPEYYQNQASGTYCNNFIFI